MNNWVSAQKEELRSDVLKLTLYELNTAISPRDLRIKALYAALREFNHNDPSKHDHELDLHADKIIFQKLSYCFSVHKNDEELGLLACAMEMVYRANRARVSISFHEVGESLLPLFVEMLRCGSTRKKEILKSKSLAEKQKEVDCDSSFKSVDDSHSYSSFNKSSGDSILLDKKKSVTSSSVSNIFLPTVSEEKKEKGEDEDDNDDDNQSEKVVQELEQDKIGPGTTFSMNDSDKIGPVTTFSMNDSDKIGPGTTFSMNDSDRIGPGTTFSMNDSESLSRSGSTFISSSAGSNISFKSKSLPKRQVRFSDSIEIEEINLKDKEERVVEGNSYVKDDDDFTNPLAVRKVIKILRYFSRVLTAMIPIAHFPGVLDELVFNLRVPRIPRPLAPVEPDDHNEENSYHSARTQYTADSDYADAISQYSGADGNNFNSSFKKPEQKLGIDNAARIDTIATIVNLACAEENKSRLLAHPGLLDAVIIVAREDPMNEAREHAAIVLMNLALEDSNKIIMAESDELLHTIVTLLNDGILNIRRYASAVLLSLACVPKNTLRLIGFAGGKVLSQLSFALMRDKVEEVRINVAECLFNCARYSTEAETIVLMGQHRGLLPSLSESVLSDYSADVRAYAARTLEWLAADIHHDSRCHGILLDALAEASQWTKTTCIIEALKSQATIAENRKSLVNHAGILDSLAQLASLHGVNDQQVRECALATIERLTHEPSTRHIMAEHEAIMTELTKATFSTTGVLDEYEEGDERSKTLMKSALKYLAKAL